MARTGVAKMGWPEASWPAPGWPGASWLEAGWLKGVAREPPLQQKRPRKGVLCSEDFHGWWGGGEGVSYTLIGG